MSSSEDNPERTAVEELIQDHAEREEFEAATTTALETYGPELLGYLHAMAPTPTEADDLFSELCERIWKNLPRFRWASSFRTWSYTIARNLLRDRHRARYGPEGRVVGLGDAPEVSRIAERLKSTTAAYLKTEAKTRLQQIRDAMDPDDRTLLILRVDRKLAWRDIAAIMADDDATPDEVAKTTARLRKRFERVKERLREELSQV